MKQYLKEINDKFNYRANWEPNKPLAIGDIGILEKGIFSLRSSLTQEKIPMQVRTEESTGNLKYTSSGAVSIKSKLSGQGKIPQSALGELDAGFSIEFNKEQAIVFEINGYKTHLVENVGEIEREVMQRFMGNTWPKDWVIITELVQADNATILISNSKDSAIDLKANGNMEASPNLSLADASLELGVVSRRGIATEIVARQGITPLYRAAGIKTKLFGGGGSLASKGDLQDAFDVIQQDPEELDN